MDTSSDSKTPGEFDAVLAIVSALQQDDICPGLLKALAKYLDIDYLTLFVLDVEHKPHLLSWSGADMELPLRAMSRYQKGLFFFSDPNTHFYQSKLDDTSWPLLARLKVADISNREYRQQVYHDNALIDRASVIGHFQQYWYSLNFYRSEPGQLFSDKDLGRIEALMPLLDQCLGLHFRLKLPSVWRNIDPRDRQDILLQKLEMLDAGLTQRESEVCIKALLGSANKVIARQLQLEPSTVATYRQRAYEKLGIRTLNQLFALLLS